MISAVSGIFLALYILRLRPARGSAALLALVLAAAFWSLNYAIEIASPDLSTKLFWARLQYLGIIVIPPAWLIFSVQYKGNSGWLERSPRNQLLLWIVPVLSLYLVWTNELHHLVWRQVGLETVGGFSMLAIDHGPWFWVLLIFSYGLLLLGSIWMLRAMFLRRSVDRRVIGFALLGVLIPWMGNLVYVTGLNPLPNLDWTPLAFIIAGLMFSISLFRFHLLDILPSAHKHVFDGLADVVLVLDLQDRIVDLNPAAKHMMGDHAPALVGQPFVQLFPEFSAPFGASDRVAELQVEIPHGEEPDLRFYFMRLAPLFNQHRTPIGRLVTLRDITQRKRDQAQLEQIRNNLEVHVFEQTAALGQANKQLQLELAQRTLAEKRFEQIVQFAPDAMFLINQDYQIVLLNAQAERLFGYSSDELCGQNIHALLPRRYHSTHSQLIDKFFSEPAVRSIGAAAGLFALHKNGHEFPVDISLSPLNTAEGLIIACAVRDITERKQAEQEQTRLLEKIRKSREQLRLLASRLQEVSEFERRQIAAELHDLIGQNLTGLNLNLTIIQNQLPPEISGAIHHRLNDSVMLVEETTRQVRDVMANLSPPLLDEFGLVAALQWYGDNFSQRTGVAIQVAGKEFSPRLPQNVEITLYRIVQEALNNVAKHAQAGRVSIRIESNGKAPRLSIEDDGLGFDTASLNIPFELPHWGVLSMQERAASVGAHLTIHSDPGKGTRVSMKLGS